MAFSAEPESGNPVQGNNYSLQFSLSNGEIIDAGTFTAPQGPKGDDGAPATVNGVNALTLQAGENISLSQSGSTLTISGESGGSSAAVYEVTIPASGWSLSNGYMTQTVTVNGLSANYDVPPDVDVSLSGTDAEADAEILAAFGLISIVSTGTNSITVKCIGDTPPSVNVPIRLRVWE